MVEETVFHEGSKVHDFQTFLGFDMLCTQGTLDENERKHREKEKKGEEREFGRVSFTPNNHSPILGISSFLTLVPKKVHWALKKLKRIQACGPGLALGPLWVFTL